MYHMNAYSELDVSQIERYAQYLIRIGVKGVFILGTTGEGYSLTLEEKIQLLEAWRHALDQNNNKLIAIVNISSTVVSEVMKLGQVVEQLVFDGTALLPPIYYTAPTVDHLVRYIKHILDRGAPNTPFLYYHIPSFTGELKCKKNLILI